MENFCFVKHSITYAKSLRLLSKKDCWKNLSKPASMDLLFDLYQWTFSIDCIKQNFETFCKWNEQAL